MLHYFNPGNETAVLNASPYYTLPANPAKMQQDLAYLPAWYANEDDLVLVDNTLDNDFLEYTQSLVSLPKSITESEFDCKRDLLTGKDVSLWGLAPYSIHQFEQYNKKHQLDLKIPIWNNEYRKLIGRRTSHACLSHLIDSIPELSGLSLPHFFSEFDFIEKCLEEQHQFQMLIKAPYSSSGRGLLWVQHPMDRASRQILQGMLNKQHEVSLENALDKQSDFAMLFHSNPDGTVDFRGYSLFETDNKGNYKGNYITSQNKIKAKLYESVDEALFERVKKELILYFSENVANLYKGCICVDMMLYKDKGQMQLHPCVEINFRHTMGWLAMNLHQKYFDEHTSGVFQIEYHKNSQLLYEKHLDMMKNKPLIVDNEKILSGYLPLCPVTDDNRFLACVLID